VGLADGVGAVVSDDVASGSVLDEHPDTIVEAATRVPATRMTYLLRSS